MVDDASTYSKYGQERVTRTSPGDGYGESIPLPPAVKAYVDECYSAEIRKRDAEIQDLKRKVSESNEIIADHCRELWRQKNEVRALEQELKGLKATAPPQQKTDKDLGYLDTRLFKGCDLLWFKKLNNVLIELANKETEDGKPVIQYANQIAFVYKVLTESSQIPYKYTGTKANFTYLWNQNIVPNIDDPKRRISLNCKELSMNSALAEWKDTSLIRIHSLALEGVKKAQRYQKLDTIKQQIETMVKKIPIN